MNKILHKADSRGYANHGWLESYHTFSFANYYDQERIQFGALRVINDDKVAGGKGFGTHPHENMEIISIPLSGELEHKDSMGNIARIKEGDIQVMSAGTGVYHSEYNKNEDKEVKFLQIWVIPNQQQVEPRYDQISIADISKSNQFNQILSPNKEDQGVWIHQDAWFNIGQFDKTSDNLYKLHSSKNGVYVFVIEGEAKVESENLQARDGLAIWDTDLISIEAGKDSRILIMEIPMN